MVVSVYFPDLWHVPFLHPSVREVSCSIIEESHVTVLFVVMHALSTPMMIVRIMCREAMESLKISKRSTKAT